MTSTATPTSALLLDEPVLLVQGRLARALGLAPALFLQQVHYWLQRSRHQHGGQAWIYNTYTQWQAQFPFLSRDQLARAVAALRRRGVLLVAHLDADPRERRNWYSIDYGRLAALLAGDAGSVPALSDPTDRPSATSAVPQPPTPHLPTAGPTPAPTGAPPRPAPLDLLSVGSVVPGPAERTPMPRCREMHDAPAAAHPEITAPESTQRLTQEEDGPSTRPSDPPPPPCALEAAPITADRPAPVPRPTGALAPADPSSPCDPEPTAASAGSSAVPSIPPSALRIPHSAGLAAATWDAYRHALDPAAPPALRTRIAADLATALVAGVALTPRGLAYALAEAATARGPCWPYLWAVWQAHPDGAAEGGSGKAEGGMRRDQSARRTPHSAFRPPHSLDPAKYRAGGKYGFLFARPAAAGA